MMDYSDRHDRYLMRLFSKNAVLYTEMVSIQALLHGDANRFLMHHPSENPVALQLGGSDPVEMAKGALLGESAGFDEININVGCPSSRVQAGQFGACLMKEPDLVSQVFQMMQEKVNIPVTIKCRLGIDNNDDYSDLFTFIDRLSLAGCTTFIVHARKAWLNGLSPKQNREIPPLNYGTVYQLKRDFSNLEIIINGGIASISETLAHLSFVDGAMIGREAYRNPALLSEVDQIIYRLDSPVIPILDVLEMYKRYIEKELALGTPLRSMTRHISGLFHGRRGARAWRHFLAAYSSDEAGGIEIIRDVQRYAEKIMRQG
tara:strand:- start:7014 stop:7964 length:951 start_codon:yes stop_codon:yes gene_type:complete